MAAGDLITADYQYEFRNFLFGSGTAYIVTEVDGILGTSDTDTSDVELETDHGSLPGLVVLRKRIITIEMSLDAAAGSDIETRLNTLAATFQTPRKRNSRVLDQFVWRRNGVKKFVWARCTKRDIKSDYDTARGKPDPRIQLEAPDPIIYGITLKTQNIVVASGATSNSGAVTNSGDFLDGYFPKITINGPATNPRIANAADGNRQLKITNVLTAGQSIVVDFATKSVKKNGVEDMSLLANDSQWFAIVPGSNTLTVNRDAGNTGASSTVTVEWRDTYQ